MYGTTLVKLIPSGIVDWSFKSREMVVQQLSKKGQQSLTHIDDKGVFQHVLSLSCWCIVVPVVWVVRVAGSLGPQTMKPLCTVVW
jgi:hypothetical protein